MPCTLRAFSLALLVSAGLANAQPIDTQSLVRMANGAYAEKNYAVSAELYTRAIDAGDHTKQTYFSAGVVHAQAGKPDRAFELLGLAIDAGFDNAAAMQSDPNLASLREDPRWLPLVARIKQKPEDPRLAQLQALMQDQQLAAPARYFPVRRALAEGLQAPPPSRSPFMQYYGTLAAMMGEYDEASARYRFADVSALDPVSKGYNIAVAANEKILAITRDRRAVFINESHGEAQTRAAIYTLLAPLRAQGFKYLAMETLTTPVPTPTGKDQCSAPRLGDKDLAKRGFPNEFTGYYTSEPIDGEIVREALRLGFELVSYEGGSNGADREQHHAEMLNCLFKADVNARVVAIAGFSHVSEAKDESFEGGWMASRFRTLTGLDPLTIATTELLRVDPTKLKFPEGDTHRSAQAYLLTNEKGESFPSDRFDVMLYVGQATHRNEPGQSWLELGGARKRFAVGAEYCHDSFPCVAEARLKGEGVGAIPSDRCVIASAAVPAGATAAGCTLYLRPGSYLVLVNDEKQALLEAIPATVE